MSESLPSSEHDCYHCGLPIPAVVDLPVEIDGAPHQMCCTGCQAVAQSIVSSGLVDYYKRRDTLPEAYPGLRDPACEPQVPAAGPTTTRT